VIRASLTGHLVLSTVHAGRAAEALLRLLEMGIAPYLLASSVTAVIAQRLVRVTCQHCAHRYQPEPELLNRLGIETDGEFRKGAGCQQCHHTGYFGRTGIFEVMSISRAIRELILRRASIDALEEQARREGMRTLLDDARMKVLAGVTTLEEVIRVLGA
ncbi:MAG TPA: type II secretion system protein GspE, partial [Armatimonadetes bacterium]|nr:type II secretion system protein GspE [Armatimonadota bacterium]